MNDTPARRSGRRQQRTDLVMLTGRSRYGQAGTIDVLHGTSRSRDRSAPTYLESPRPGPGFRLTRPFLIRLVLLKRCCQSLTTEGKLIV
jgi:hypothetical protein